MADPIRRYTGRRNRTQGKAFEEMIRSACDYYRTHGIADIQKTPEPMKVLESLPRGRFIACFEKRAQPDYKGTLYGGRAVMFECKETATDKLMQDVVTPEQAHELDRQQKFGAQCFVLFLIRHQAYRLEWQDWQNMKERFGHKFISAEDAATLTPIRMRAGVPDFLDAIGTEGPERAAEFARFEQEWYVKQLK